MEELPRPDPALDSGRNAFERLVVTAYPDFTNGSRCGAERDHSMTEGDATLDVWVALPHYALKHKSLRCSDWCRP